MSLFTEYKIKTDQIKVDHSFSFRSHCFRPFAFLLGRKVVLIADAEHVKKAHSVALRIFVCLGLLCILPISLGLLLTGLIFHAISKTPSQIENFKKPKSVVVESVLPRRKPRVARCLLNEFNQAAKSTFATKKEN